MVHTLPKLGYAFDALEPYIDEKTMMIHHGKHHQGYVDKLNAALKGEEKLGALPVEDLLKDLDSVPESIRTAVRNNGGGHLNHSMFWQVLKKDSGSPEGKLAEAMNATFGSYDKFKDEFSKAAIGRFGSGWAWLVVNEEGALEVMSTANQDSPVIYGKKPILGLDVWEHAYYLKYQNRRPEYVENFFKVINWEKVGDNYSKAIGR